MQVLWPYLLPVLPIAILAKEDFYRRRVGLFWLILSGVSLAIVGYAVEGICVMALHFACNTILAGILFGFIVFGIEYGIDDRSGNFSYTVLVWVMLS